MSVKSEKYLNSWRPRTSQEKLALKLINVLSKAGYSHSYIVGGYIRDLLMGRKETGMIDVATEAPPQQVSKLLARRGFRIIPTGLKHGTVTVHHGKDDIEITTFRQEGKYLDRRHPEKVSFIKSPQQDSARRDFTINAFYFDPRARIVRDYQGGFEDLKNRRLKFVGSARARISEDALRLMRAVRFACVLNFSLSPADLATIKKSAKLIKQISSERVKMELDKIMLSPNHAQGLDLLNRSGLLLQILPEIEKLNHTPQSKDWHSEGNVFVHTLLGFSKLEAGSSLSTSYGLLFHDVGKSQTLERKIKDGRTHTSFYNHMQVGEEITKKVLKRLRFSNSEIDEIAWYVQNSHVPFGLKQMRVSKQMAWALDPRFENLLKIYRADSLASIPSDRKGRKLKPSLVTYQYAIKTLKRARSQKQLQKRLVSGDEVMKILKIGSGPQVGRALNEIRDLQLAGKIKTHQEALAHLKSQ